VVPRCTSPTASIIITLALTLVEVLAKIRPDFRATKIYLFAKLGSNFLFQNVITQINNFNTSMTNVISPLKTFPFLNFGEIFAFLLPKLSYLRESFASFVFLREQVLQK
jgi:hypothetical protein